MKKYEKFIEKAKEIYQGDQTGHAFDHIERVLAYCIEINKEEKADQDVVVISALFHDVHRIMSNQRGEFVFAEDSIEQVEKILSEFHIEEEKLNRILHVIAQHDNKRSDESMPIELQIVQDADALDSLGEVGLSRTLAYCKKNNIPLVDRRFSLDCSEYIPDVNPISTCHYIYRTMVQNAKHLHTRKGKEIGAGLTMVLENFLKEKLNIK